MMHVPLQNVHDACAITECTCEYVPTYNVHGLQLYMLTIHVHERYVHMFLCVCLPQVHYFSLNDIHARGYVRQYAFSYVTSSIR